MFFIMNELDNKKINEFLTPTPSVIDRRESSVDQPRPTLYINEELKEHSSFIFLIGILFGVIFNVLGLVFMFISEKKHLQLGYFIGVIFFVFFLLLTLGTIYLYNITEIAF